jgi:hypothetical protein
MNWTFWALSNKMNDQAQLELLPAPLIPDGGQAAIIHLVWPSSTIVGVTPHHSALVR